VEEKILIHQEEIQIEAREIELLLQGKIIAEDKVEKIHRHQENPAELIQETKQGLLAEKIHQGEQISLQITKEKVHQNKIKQLLSQNQIKEENNQEAQRKRVLQKENSLTKKKEAHRNHVVAVKQKAALKIKMEIKEKAALKIKMEIKEAAKINKANKKRVNQKDHSNI